MVTQNERRNGSSEEWSGFPREREAILPGAGNGGERGSGLNLFLCLFDLSIRGTIKRGKAGIQRDQAKRRERSTIWT